jgi:hypothetical protein
VRGREKGEFVHRSQQFIIHQARAREWAGKNCLESDRFDRRQTLQRLARTDDIVDALADRGGVIGTIPAGLADPFHPSIGQRHLFRHLQHAVLEGGATDIGDQTYHGDGKTSGEVPWLVTNYVLH